MGDLWETLRHPLAVFWGLLAALGGGGIIQSRMRTGSKNRSELDICVLSPNIAKHLFFIGFDNFFGFEGEQNREHAANGWRKSCTHVQNVDRITSDASHIRAKADTSKIRPKSDSFGPKPKIHRTQVESDPNQSHKTQIRLGTNKADFFREKYHQIFFRALRARSFLIFTA